MTRPAAPRWPPPKSVAGCPKRPLPIPGPTAAPAITCRLAAWGPWRDAPGGPWEKGGNPRTRGGGGGVRVVDAPGTTLPDTPLNQAAYPQPTQQAPGCGFPVLKLVALMSLATGAVVHYTCGTLVDHDQPLFHRLWPTLAPGDVVLGDRIFGSFATMALLSQRGIDLEARRHAGRKERPGKCLGKGDRLVEWTATPRPPWPRPTDTLPQHFRAREGA